jgi:hypothetical protein
MPQTKRNKDAKVTRNQEENKLWTPKPNFFLVRVYKIPVLSPLFFFSLSASAVKFSSSASPTFFSTSSRSSSASEHFL